MRIQPDGDFEVVDGETVKVTVTSHKTPFLVTFGPLRSSTWHSIHYRSEKSQVRSFTMGEGSRSPEDFTLGLDFIAGSDGQVPPEAHYTVTIQGDRGDYSWSKEIRPVSFQLVHRTFQFERAS